MAVKFSDLPTARTSTKTAATTAKTKAANGRRPFDGSGDDDDFGKLLTDAAQAQWRRLSRRVMASIGRDGSSHSFDGAKAVAAMLASETLRLIRLNLAPHRLFSVPHLLAAFWALVLLWGERWTFHAQVSRCQWDHWEKWPSHATPHHLVFVADPQITDAHSYPGRPWPLSSLTITITDNYLRRSYRELQEQLMPDTIMFLGDMFDGGREWRTDHGDFEDPAWNHRPEGEKGHAKRWKKKYGQKYWLDEYKRIHDMFFEPWSLGDGTTGNKDKEHGRRRLIASLPGNHDVGFGSEVQVTVRDRFESYFGDANRVDVIGNHTFVSVDTVSLSAASSEQAGQDDVRLIYEPVQKFLDQVAWTKQKAVAQELRHQRGDLAVDGARFQHKAEEARTARVDLDELRRSLGRVEGSESAEGSGEIADLPTILLTHVPLYRPPGTPCGPQREHWPPAKPGPDGKAVVPDHRNAISVSGGYQYQNVLSEEDSVRLVKSLGNVIHAFSGDDHDYCELVHDERQGGVPEITVKSMGMNMGVPTPGFLMVSLYNPIDSQGQPLAAATADPKKGKQSSATPHPTMQTHLCLLPNQLSTYARYAGMIVVSLVLLAVRAILVPVLGLQPFAAQPQEAGGDASVLPLFKAKTENGEYGSGYGNSYNYNNSYSNGHGSRQGNKNHSVSADSSGSSEKGGYGGASGFTYRPPASFSRGRSQSNNGRWGEEQLQPAMPPNHQHHHQHRHKNRSNLRGSVSPSAARPPYEMRSGPKIQITRDDDEYDDDGEDESNDFLDVDDYYSYRGGGGNGNGSGSSSSFWRPVLRHSRGRGFLGASMAALSGLVRTALRTLGVRTSGRGWRRGGLGGLGSRKRYGQQQSSPQRAAHVALRELWTTAWRVTWMVVVYWSWLNHKG